MGLSTRSRSGGVRVLSMLQTVILLTVALLGSIHSLWGRRGEIAVVSVVDDSSWAECLIRTHSIVESAHNSANLTLYFMWSQETEVSKLWTQLLRLSVAQSTRVISNVVNYGVSILPDISDRSFDRRVIYDRFYIPQTFPEIQGKFLYLDNDVIATISVAEIMSSSSLRLSPEESAHLTSNPLRKGDAAVAFVFDKSNFYDMYIPSTFNTSKERVLNAFRNYKKRVYFNSGVMIADARIWRESNLTTRLESTMRENRDKGLFRVTGGDQAALILTLGDSIASLPAHFNIRRHPIAPAIMEYITSGGLGLVHFNGKAPKYIDICRIDSTSLYRKLRGSFIPIYLAIHDSFMGKFGTAVSSFLATHHIGVPLLLQLNCSWALSSTLRGDTNA